MNKLKIAVTGCLGKMGQQIIKSAKKNKNLELPRYYPKLGAKHTKPQPAWKP